MTYIAMKKIIESGNYEIEEMQNKLDIFFLGNRITKAQYEELKSMLTSEGKKE